MRCGGSGLQPLAAFPEYCVVCEMRTPQTADGRTARHEVPRDAPLRRLHLSFEVDQPTAAEVRLGLGRCKSCAERRHSCWDPCNCPRPACVDQRKNALAPKAC